MATEQMLVFYVLNDLFISAAVRSRPGDPEGRSGRARRAILGRAGPVGADLDAGTGQNGLNERNR